jgi:hypothetical protein
VTLGAVILTLSVLMIICSHQFLVSLLTVVKSNQDIAYVGIMFHAYDVCFKTIEDD